MRWRRTAGFSAGETRDAMAFYQHRVAIFGLVASEISLSFLLFRILSAGAAWRKDVDQPSFNYHLAGLAATALIWLLTRGRLRPLAHIQTIESVGFVATCVAYQGMGFSIPTIPVGGYLILFVLTLILFSRAVYVPSTPRRTLLLGIVVGIPMIPWTYFSVGALATPANLDLLRDLTRIQSVHALAVQASVGMGFSWLMAVLLATGTSRVIFGLRREARAARRLGQYTLEAKLGEGGMGVVYRAQHAMLRRPTAVKLLPPERTGGANLARFEREVQLTASLTHPHTVTVFDYGRTTDGVFYYAMELLDGASLDTIVAAGGPLRPARVIHILHRVASALAEAHEAGLIHRDIKPANIILCRQGGIDDFPKVVDFGLVKEIHRDTANPSLTQADAITGTPLYMSPETITASDLVGPRADLYSLGAVGYFALTAQHLFTGRTLVEICSHHLHTQPMPPSGRLGSPLPPDLEALILDCLAKSPSARPSSAAALCQRLEACELFGSWSPQDAREWWARHRKTVQQPLDGGNAAHATLTRLPTPESS